MEVAVAVAALVLLGWVAAPSLFPGASKRAKEGTASTERLEAATVAKGAEVAASVATIASANAEAPESPSKAFISKETPLALSLLPPPSPSALIEAEKRKVAVMEGRLDEARRLYETAAAKADRLQKERDDALDARRRADAAFERAAAAEHARTVQAMGIGVVALIALVAWGYVKMYSITPASLGGVVADIRAGMNPISAIDTALAPRLHKTVRRAAKLATEPRD